MRRLEMPSIADELDRADPRTSRLTPIRRDDVHDGRWGTPETAPRMVRVVSAVPDARGQNRCLCGAEKHRNARFCSDCYQDLKRRGLV